MLLKLYCVHESPENPLKCRFRFSSLEQSLRCFISNKFSGDADAACPGSRFWVAEEQSRYRVCILSPPCLVSSESRKRLRGRVAQFCLDQVKYAENKTEALIALTLLGGWNRWVSSHTPERQLPFQAKGENMPSGWEHVFRSHIPWVQVLPTWLPNKDLDHATLPPWASVYSSVRFKE